MISDNKIVQLSITCLVLAAHQDQKLALALAPEIRRSHSSLALSQDSFTLSTAFVANQVISYCVLEKHPFFHNLRFPDLHHRCPCHLATSQDPVMPLRWDFDLGTKCQFWVTCTLLLLICCYWWSGWGASPWHFLQFRPFPLGRPSPASHPPRSLSQGPSQPRLVWISISKLSM